MRTVVPISIPHALIHSAHRCFFSWVDLPQCQKDLSFPPRRNYASWDHCSTQTSLKRVTSIINTRYSHSGSIRSTPLALKDHHHLSFGVISFWPDNDVDIPSPFYQNNSSDFRYRYPISSDQFSNIGHFRPSMNRWSDWAMRRKLSRNGKDLQET